jgi:hypothetical protein
LFPPRIQGLKKHRIPEHCPQEYLRIHTTAIKEEKIWKKIGTNLTLLLSGSLLSGKDSGRNILDVSLLHITGPGKGEKIGLFY